MPDMGIPVPDGGCRIFRQLMCRMGDAGYGFLIVDAGQLMCRMEDAGYPFNQQLQRFSELYRIADFYFSYLVP